MRNIPCVLSAQFPWDKVSQSKGNGISSDFTESERKS